MDADDVSATLANPVRRRLLELLAEGPRNAGALEHELPDWMGPFELAWRNRLSGLARTVEDGDASRPDVGS